MEVFGAGWLKHAIQNGRKELVDIDKMEVNLGIKRIIVCGTGPSLDTDIDKLKEIHDNDPHTWIMSNHSNTSTLLFYGIVPDLVSVVDSQELTLTRFKRDIFPSFSEAMRRRKTKFIMPTHIQPQLVDLIQKFKFELYFYMAFLRIYDPADAFPNFFNDILGFVTQPSIQTTTLQAGCVSNASVLNCFTMKLAGILPNLEEVICSGVDYAYPHGITRCTQITWNERKENFDVEKNVTFLGSNIGKVYYNGLLTSEDQVSYYRDLRFLALNMKLEDESLPFRMFTSQQNFISDFLEVKALGIL